MASSCLCQCSLSHALTATENSANLNLLKTKICLRPDSSFLCTQSISRPHAWTVWAHGENARTLMPAVSFHFKCHQLQEEISNLSDNSCKIFLVCWSATLVHTCGLLIVLIKTKSRNLSNVTLKLRKSTWL